MARVVGAGFEARFDGVCQCCGMSIYAGERITQSEGGGYEHVLCPPGAFDDEPLQPLCPHCFTYHAGECP